MRTYLEYLENLLDLYKNPEDRDPGDISAIPINSREQDFDDMLSTYCLQYEADKILKGEYEEDDDGYIIPPQIPEEYLISFIENEIRLNKGA